MEPIIDSDSELLESSLGGNHEAFGRIVERYESLVRTVAYGATGNSAMSEDVAQETFIAAWQGLASLRHPNRLKAWLCAIARNLARNTVRHRARSVLGRTVPLDSVAEPEFGAPSAHDEAVTKEREAIVWESLRTIPAVYREPMILFYREGKPVRVVAETLGIGEEAVKQRLLRGRKFLQAQVSAILEETLVQTRPKRALAPAVLAALPAAGSKIGAGSALVGAASGAAALKEMLGAWFLGTLATPIFWVLFLFQGARANIDRTFSPRERRFMFWATWGCVVLAVAMVVAHRALVVRMALGDGLTPATAQWRTWGYAAAMVLILGPAVIFASLRQARIRAEDAAGAGESSPLGGAAKQAASGETVMPVAAGEVAKPSLLAVTASCGGFVFLGVFWLLLLAWLLGEWWTFGVTVAFAGGLCAWAVRQILTAPPRRAAVMAQTVGLMAVFALAVFSLRWGPWMERYALCVTHISVARARAPSCRVLPSLCSHTIVGIC